MLRSKLAFTVLFVVAVTLGAGIVVRSVAAQSPDEPVVNLLAVDADPTGNTATSLGSIDDCVVASQGQQLVMDIVVDAIPPAGTTGFATDVLYNPAVLRVAQIDYNQLMAAAGGAIMFAFADPLPDSDGDYRADIADLSQNFETGPGVLVRLTFDVVGSGISQVVLSDEREQDGFPDVLDSNSVLYPINEVRAASISVGQACPSPADLRVVSATVTAPGQATAGVPMAVTVDSSIVDAGPYGPMNVDTTTSLVLPADCTAAGGATQTTQDTLLQVAQPVAVSHSFSVTCTQASFHSIAAQVTVAADDPVGIESNPGDNTRAAAPATVAVIGESDFELGALSPSSTPDPFAGMPFTISVSAPAMNGGPYGPATAHTSVLLTMPADCAAYSPNPATQNQAVNAGGSASALLNWKVVCDGYGTHSFSFSATVSPGDLHVTDPAGANGASGSLPADVFVGACGPDPAPAGDPIQNMGPELISLIAQLTDGGSFVPEQFRKPLSCLFDQTATDTAGTPVNDCPIGVASEQPCSLDFDMTIDLPGGSPSGVPSVRLAPIGVTFVPIDYDWAPDANVPNGSPNGFGKFKIRTDGALLPNGVPCVLDVRFDPTPGYEGAIEGNAPESNQVSDLTNPNVWPNDLNAERAKVEASFQLDPQLPSGITLWSRTIIPLQLPGVSLPLNVLTWKITDPEFQVITGAQWLLVPFPGDAVGPDPAGTIGGDPDADDPDPGHVPTTTCAPHNVELSFNGMAGGSVFLHCLTPGSHMTWQLIDPDARSVTGDDGPRTDVATCSADLDGDGLSQAAEEYWGTNQLSTDSDGDGHSDASDNCKTLSNAGQEDLDSDRAGDDCDDDDENDGVADAADNCPRTVNPAQENSVHPVTPAGDHCEDPDQDTVMDVGDNCPDAANPGQENNVHPESPAGDHCDDPDNDGVQDILDNCADTANASQENRVHFATAPGDHCEDPDGDAVMDVVDNCADAPNPGQENADGDDYGDACESAQCLTTPNFWKTPSNDTDCDGFADSVSALARASESFLGTNAADQCSNTSTAGDEPVDAWPVDLNDDQRTNLSDVVMIGPHFNKISPNPDYAVRFDMNGDTRVNLSDVVLFGPFFNKGCTP